MLRSYTVTFAFVTFRLLARLLVTLHFGSREDIDSVMAWACWAIPLLAIEPLIQASKIRGARLRRAES